jgi:hypothetical protein
MKLPTKKTIDRMVEKAKRQWALTDWTVIWEFGDLNVEGESDTRYWPEKKALITIDRDTAREVDRKHLYRIIVHELGHAVIAPPWRGVTDWIDDKEMLPQGTKERRIFDEQYNTRENEVIDFIATHIFKL